MTAHFIAYQNRDVNGPYHRDSNDKKAKESGFRTLKQFRPETLIGQRLWVFEGGERPKRYSLVSAGIIKSLRRRKRPSWPNNANQVRFDVDPTCKRIDVTDLPWFKRLLRQQRSFFNGFSSIKDGAIIHSLEGLTLGQRGVASRIDLLRVLRYLPEKGPITLRLFPGPSPRRHWIDWISDHRHQDPRLIFNRLESPRMILWLAEASGVERRLLLKAGVAISKADSKPTQAATIRRIIPWSLIEANLGRIAPQIDEIEDVEELRRDRKIRNETTRKALVDARLGMGEFRSSLQRRWKNQCAVTGCKISEILRASHIKPWATCNNGERLDPENGILLIAHLDALFDRGLISFSDDGLMLLSPKIDKKDRTMFRLPAKLRSKVSKSQRQFLNHHRKRFGF